MSGAALVKKDLRLAIGALGPWALVLCTLVVTALVTWGLPVQQGASPPHAITLERALLVVGQVLAYATVPLAAVVAAAISKGDRDRGAAVLHGTLPVSSTKRIASHAMAASVMLFAFLAIALVIVALGASLSSYPGSVAGSVRRVATTTLQLQLVAVCYISIACVWTRGASHAVALSVGLVMIAAMMGLLGADVGIRLGVGSLIGALDHEGGRGWTSSLRILDAARFEGALVGVVAGGIVGAVLTAADVLRPRRLHALSRRPLMIGGVAVLLASAVVAPRLVRADNALTHSPVYRRVAARAASDNELAARLTRNPVAEDLTEARKRVLNSWSNRESNVLAIALRELEDYSTPRASLWSLRELVLMDDPRRFGLALDLIARFPERAADILDALHFRGGSPLSMTRSASRLRLPWLDRRTQAIQYEWWRRCEALDALERVNLDGYPEQESLLRAREAVRRSLEANATEASP